MWRVFLPQCPQVFSCQRGAIPLHNKPEEAAKASHTTWKTYYCKQVQTVAVVRCCDSVVTHQKSKIRGFKSYPVNHQKRIFDRNEASFTGQGFCNRLQSRVKCFSAVNLSYWKYTTTLIQMIEWCTCGYTVCVNSLLKSRGPLYSHMCEVSTGWTWRFEV